MARWDFLQRENARDSEVRPSREERQQESSGAGVSVGRGPTDGSSPNSPERPERPSQPSPERSPERRTQYGHGGRTYSLRSSEIASMRDIGTFRTVDIRDLGRFVYGGDEGRRRERNATPGAAGVGGGKKPLPGRTGGRRRVRFTAGGARRSAGRMGPSCEREE